MEYQNRLYLPNPNDSGEVNLPLLKCLPGKVAVVMLPERETFGSILLPDEAQGRMRPDCGFVAAVGDARLFQDASYGYDCHLMRGDMVLVRPAQGLWTDDLTDSQVRFYGGAHSHGAHQNVDWWDDVVMYKKDGKWEPTGRNLLIKRRKYESSILTEDRWLSEGVVLSQGPYMEHDLCGCTVAWSDDKWDDVLTLQYGEFDDDSTVLVPDYLVQVLVEK
jgi:hypothetical protein